MTILGAAGRDATTLDVSLEDTGAGELHVINFAERVGEGPLLVEGLTLTGARRPGVGGGAVLAVAADGLVVRQCRFFENESTTPQGVAVGAAIAGAECDVEVIDSLIDANASIAGVIFVLDCNLTVRGCRFEGNTGRCVQFDSEGLPFSALIEDSEFIRNRGRGYGVGVDLTQTSSFTIRRCQFVENVSEEFPGAAVYVGGCRGQIEYCVFERDSCLASNSRGGGIWWDESSGEIHRNTFAWCHSGLGGGAFTAVSSGTVSFAKNIVAHSTGGAAVARSESTVTGEGCNDFWSNAEGDFENWIPAATDLFVDPIFCAPETGDYSLREDSPCIVGGCGQVGALGVGCEGVAVESISWARIKGLYHSSGR